MPDILHRPGVKIALLIFSGLALLAWPAWAEMPKTLAFQGKLTDQTGQPTSGSIAVTFRLYAAETSGSPLWEETQTVTATQGLFSARLGTAAPLTLAFDQPYWVELQVGSEVLTPRQPLSASPYAVNAERLGGLPAGTFLRPDSAGNIGIGTASPANRLDVAGTVRSMTETVPSSGTGTEIMYNAGQNRGLLVAYDRSATAYKRLDLNDVITIAGGGNAGAVGIGTANPGARLDVAGNIKMSGPRTKLFYRGDTDGHIGSLALYSPDGGRTAIITPYGGTGEPLPASTVSLGGFGNFDTNTVSLHVSGHIGIGTASPANRLDVAGTVRSMTETVPSSGTGTEIMYNAGQNRGLLVAYDRSATAYKRLDLNDVITIAGGGNAGAVGIGTANPGARLDVAGNIKMSGPRTKLFYRGDTDGHIGSLALYSPDGGRTAIITPYGGTGEPLPASTVSLGGFGNFDTNTVSLRVSGDVHVPNGALFVRSRQLGDLAEPMRGGTAVLPGMLVTVDPLKGGQHVVPTAQAYEPAVLGVVSNDPAITIGGIDGEDAKPVALSGIVTVKATAESGPIRRGDRLVAASRPGSAMRLRLEDPDAAGDFPTLTRLLAENQRREAAVFGIALEELAAGEGEVLVFLK